MGLADGQAWEAEYGACSPALKPIPEMKEKFAVGKQSDGYSTSYYKIPEGANDLQDIIEAKNMNFAQGNIFKAIYRLGVDGNDTLYDLNKIIWFAERMKAQCLKNGAIPPTEWEPEPEPTNPADEYPWRYVPSYQGVRTPPLFNAMDKVDVKDFRGNSFQRMDPAAVIWDQVEKWRISRG